MEGYWKNGYLTALYFGRSARGDLLRATYLFNIRSPARATGCYRSCLPPCIVLLWWLGLPLLW